MIARPPAKVNLTLRVSPRGRDGFHALESVFLRVGLSDELDLALAQGRDRDALSVSGLPGAPIDGNLVLRAFALTRRALGADLPTLVAHLDKRIPVAAGLGGGSSDAAAAVRCALQMSGAGLAPDRRAAVAQELGSDVPFFASRAAVARVRGRGELVEPIEADLGELGLLLVTPPIALSTSAVFAYFDDLDERSGYEVPTPDLGDLADSLDSLRDANDLWRAAASLAPTLTLIRDDLEHGTNRPWLMSGSGSTLYTIYPSAAAAVGAGRDLAASRSEILSGAAINAVDLIGPDPLWRYS